MTLADHNRKGTSRPHLPWTAKQSHFLAIGRVAVLGWGRGGGTPWLS